MFMAFQAHSFLQNVQLHNSVTQNNYLLEGLDRLKADQADQGINPEKKRLPFGHCSKGGGSNPNAKVLGQFFFGAFLLDIFNRRGGRGLNPFQKFWGSFQVFLGCFEVVLVVCFFLSQNQNHVFRDDKLTMVVFLITYSYHLRSAIALGCLPG